MQSSTSNWRTSTVQALNNIVPPHLHAAQPLAGIFLISRQPPHSPFSMTHVSFPLAFIDISWFVTTKETNAQEIILCNCQVYTDNAKGYCFKESSLSCAVNVLCIDVQFPFCVQKRQDFPESETTDAGNCFTPFPCTHPESLSISVWANSG